MNIAEVFQEPKRSCGREVVIVPALLVEEAREVKQVVGVGRERVWRAAPGIEILQKLTTGIG